MIAVLVAYAAALAAYLLHYLKVNPQYDTQVIWYAQDLINAAYKKDALIPYLLSVRKYPLGYVLPFGLVYRVVLFAQDPISQPVVFFVGRLITLLHALGCVVVLRSLSRRMFGQEGAMWLLLSSICFLLFSTAVRPHMPVAFWTLLSFSCALRARERGAIRDVACSFGSAFLAFVTLQSGLLAFIFPVWAVLAGPRGTRSQRILGAAAGAGVTLLVALVVGYPFLLSGIVPRAGGVNLSLGHEVEMGYSFARGVWVLGLALGSETLLLAFAALGIWRLFRHQDERRPEHAVMAFYIAAFAAVFLFHVTSALRFFLPTLPFLALFGAEAFAAAPRRVRLGFFVLLLFGAGKLAYLAVIPNTYQQATAFVAARPGRIGFDGQPSYFFDLPPERLVTTDADEASMYTVVESDDLDAHPQPGRWKPCFQAVASPTSDGIQFLWNEVSWAIFRLVDARALGPNMTVYCDRRYP